jgi:hypothetical protein
MTLKDQINREFNRVASHSGGPDGQAFSVDTGAGDLQCELTALDNIACAFTHFTLATDKLADASLDQLKRVSESLSKKLSYLLEPISPVETDPDGCTIQMRSSPPHKDDDGTSYYELLVRGGQLSLCRYTKSSGADRRVIEAHVTREVFQRLAGDFTAAVA